MNHTITSRQRLQAALNHRPLDRIPMIETCFWPETLDRWHNEGLPKNADPTEYFQLDRIEHFFGIFDCTLQAEPKIMEETETYIVQRNRYGAVMREPKGFSQPSVMLEPAIRNRNDWERLRDTLQPAADRFTDPGAVGRAREAQRRGTFVTLETIEPLWFVLYNTMGFERGLEVMAEDPDLIEEMVDTYAQFSVQMLDLCFDKGFTADALFLYSDLCYKTGLLFSPAAFRRLALPHLKRFDEFCRRRGLYFFWHSDGNVGDLLPLLSELGVHAVHPLEARAGNDVRIYKRTFGRSMCLIGNIDADIVAKGDKSQIEEEVAGKIIPAKQGGGYIYHIDHSVPPTVSLDSYAFLLEQVRKHGNYDGGCR